MTQTNFVQIQTTRTDFDIDLSFLAIFVLVHQQDNIAIIYFSRTVKQEVEHKKWSSNTTKSQRLAISDFLNSRSLRTIKQSGLKVLHFDENNQKGQHFGEKIANAFESAFELGFDSVITVGNDCLDLPQVDFTQITRTLNQGRNVLGPTFRKGAYLIGLRKQDFDKERFQNLTWQSTGLKVDLFSYFDDQSSPIEVLETYRDANNLGDLKQLLRSLRNRASILRNLKNFIAFELQTLTFTVRTFVQQRFFNFENLRAPPYSS